MGLCGYWNKISTLSKFHGATQMFMEFDLWEWWLEMTLPTQQVFLLVMYNIVTKSKIPPMFEYYLLLG